MTPASSQGHDVGDQPDQPPTTEARGRLDGETNDLTVIIPVFRGMNTLPACLEALEGQTASHSSYEVVVVDNGDNPGIEELMARYPEWRLLREERPSSYAARNRALAAGTRSLIAFTDADCRPARDWLEAGRQLLLTDESIGLIGGPVDLDLARPGRPSTVECYELAVAFRQKTYLETQGYAATANVFTRRSVIESVGNFNDSLKSTGDSEWGKRVAASEYELAYCESARVHHHPRSSWSAVWRREARKVGGVFDQRRAHHGPLGAYARGVLRSFLPTQTVKAVIASDRITSQQKARALFVVFALSGVRVIELTRLLLGASSRRE